MMIGLSDTTSAEKYAQFHLLNISFVTKKVNNIVSKPTIRDDAKTVWFMDSPVSSLNVARKNGFPPGYDKG